MPNQAIIGMGRGTDVQGWVQAQIIDGFLSTQQQVSVDATSVPIESGARIVDHVAVKPVEITVQGQVSDLEGDGRAAGFWAVLQRQLKDADPVEVITSWQTYPEMIITQVSSQEHGRGGMRFTMQLREILRISLDTNPGAANGSGAAPSNVAFSPAPNFARAPMQRRGRQTAANFDWPASVQSRDLVDRPEAVISADWRRVIAAAPLLATHPPRQRRAQLPNQRIEYRSYQRRDDAASLAGEARAASRIYELRPVIAAGDGV